MKSSKSWFETSKKKKKSQRHTVQESHGLKIKQDIVYKWSWEPKKQKEPYFLDHEGHASFSQVIRGGSGVRGTGGCSNFVNHHFGFIIVANHMRFPWCTLLFLFPLTAFYRLVSQDLFSWYIQIIYQLLWREHWAFSTIIYWVPLCARHYSTCLGYTSEQNSSCPSRAYLLVMQTHQKQWI